MLKIDRELTGIREADELIKNEIIERIIALVNEEIAGIKLEPGILERKYYTEIIFPKNYPMNKRQDKLEELRETLVSRSRTGMDSICKYVLYHVITLHCFCLEELTRTSREPLENREYINRILYANYGKIEDRLRFINYYENYSNYPRLIFDNFDFLTIEEEPAEILEGIEILEKIR